MPGQIFVNYRRDDSAFGAARLRDRLAAAFGNANVFMDVDNLLAGQRFDKGLEQALSRTDVFLAVIGPRWTDMLKSRAGSAEPDYVVEEISAALQKGIPVIPVLIDRAQMPNKADVPEAIREVLLYQTHTVTHERFNRDADDLIAAIRTARKSSALPAAASSHFAGTKAFITGGLALFVLAAGLMWYWASRNTGPATAPLASTGGQKVVEGQSGLASSTAAAKLKSDAEERQRVEEQRLRAAAAAEAKRRSDEAERQRVASLKVETDRTSPTLKAALDPANTLVIELKSGPVQIQLLPDLAPKHVARVKQLAKENFYNGIKFHRVIDGFMAQTGDPTGTGGGGSKYGSLPAEFSKYVYKRGTVGAARTSDPNSANSQFYLCFNDTGCQGLTGQYTVWGQVISGMEHVDKIKRGAPGSGAVTDPDVMQKVYLLSDKK